VIALVFAAAISTGSTAVAAAGSEPEAKGALSLVVENDLFARTDRGYTSGLRLGLVTPPNGTPSWAKNLARQISWFSDWCVVRAEYALNQSMFTPTDGTLPVPDPRDHPYAGWLQASFGLIGEDNSGILDQLSVGLGIVGPASLGQNAQDFIHHLKAIPVFEGWAYQLRNEPTVQLQYQRSWRRFFVSVRKESGLGVDLTPHVGFALGNAYTYGQAGATIRVGTDLREDYGPPRVGPSVPGSGFFEPSHGIDFSGYVFASVEGRAVARNLFLDGNTFVGGPRVTKLPFVIDAQAGAVVHWNRLRLSYTHVWRTKEFQAAPVGDQFGVVSVSFRVW
jgi:hypothetical protein